MFFNQLDHPKIVLKHYLKNNEVLSQEKMISKEKLLKTIPFYSNYARL
ncbi:hypothetical protein HYX11_05130 [Candidatus Woesearchaeota archaeon]|nr:hypothetical protein [Candidatus Woesearchaeota archaeon]